jgi:hypothetical protein
MPISLEDALLTVHQQSLIENRKTISLGKKGFPVSINSQAKAHADRAVLHYSNVAERGSFGNRRFHSIRASFNCNSKASISPAPRSASFEHICFATNPNRSSSELDILRGAGGTSSVDSRLLEGRASGLLLLRVANIFESHF